MTESRLTELETKLAFAEDLLERSTRRYPPAGANRLDAATIRLLHQQLQDVLPNDDARNPRDEIPPHY